MTGSFDGVMWTLYLALLVNSLFFLTLLPALKELIWPQDNLPLKVVREHDNNIAHFARGFGRFVETKLGALLSETGETEVRRIPMDSGDPCILLGRSAIFSLTTAEKFTLAVSHLVVGSGNLTLPDHILFEAEVFAKGNFTGGVLAAYRAVLVHGSAVLGKESVILRWIHTHGCLSVGAGVQLFGRASSDERIELMEDVVFERLYAPEIIFGVISQFVAPYFVTPLFNWHPVTDFEEIGAQWRVTSDVSIPPEHACKIPLVVTGNVHIGKGCLLHAAVKSNGEMVLGKNCRIDDAVVATGPLEIGSGCHIKGPIISEVEIRLRQGCVIGAAATPTTISAPRILIEPGVRVHGTVWARTLGKVQT